MNMWYEFSRRSHRDYCPTSIRSHIHQLLSLSPLHVMAVVGMSTSSSQERECVQREGWRKADYTPTHAIPRWSQKSANVRGYQFLNAHPINWRE